MAGFHSAMSPSKIKQFATCHASFAASEGLPDRSRYDAIEGTAAHTIHERCLKSGYKAATFVGEHVLVQEPDKPYEILVDDDMAYFVQESVDRCNEVRGITFVEVRVDVSKWTPIPNQSGTADFFAINERERTLYVFDFKYGKGILVLAYKNPQMIYYALGALEAYGCMYTIERVVIRVHQPRLDNWDEWITTPTELYELGVYYKALLSRCFDVAPTFRPDVEACRFCRAKLQCPARAEQLRRTAVGMFEDLDADIAPSEIGDKWPDAMPSVDLMTVEQLVTVHNHTALMYDFLSGVKTQLTHLLMHSTEVPGLKLVEGISKRRYRSMQDERAASAFLVRHGVSPLKVFAPLRTVSPAKAERLIPKDLRPELAAYVVKPPGRPTIAPIDDRRSTYVLTAAAQFDDLGDDDEDAPE